MENKQHQKMILKALSKEIKNGHGLSLSDMERNIPLLRCQIRITVAFLLGAGKIEEQVYGRSKVYYEVKE